MEARYTHATRSAGVKAMTDLAHVSNHRGTHAPRHLDTNRQRRERKKREREREETRGPVGTRVACRDYRKKFRMMAIISRRFDVASTAPNAVHSAR